MKKIALITAMMLIPLFSGLPALAAVETVDNIANQLICQCGCYSVLNNCTHQECTSRETMLGIIKQKLDQGQTGQVIVASFVRQYGEKVLSEPPKKGFNLTAWIAPFAAILLGATIIYLALKKWLRRGENTAAIETAVTTEVDIEYRQRIERELKEFPEKGFR